MIIANPNEKKLLLSVCFLILIGYSFVLKAPFKTMDDQVAIVQNDAIKNFANLPGLFQRGFFNEDRTYYRPLVSVGIMVQYHFFKLNPFFYYLCSILLHILNTAAVYLLSAHLIQNRRYAFLIALAFGIHPVQWESVSNIADQAILLCAFFYLNSFLCFCLFQERKKNIFYAASVCLFFLALLCKEEAATLPILLFVYFMTIKKEARINFIARFSGLLPFFIALALYLALRMNAGITQAFYWPSRQEAFLGFMTFLRGLLTYLRLFVFPVDLHFDRARPLFVNILNAEFILTLMFFLTGAVLLWRLRKAISAEFWFFFFWFLFLLLPVSQIFYGVGMQPGFISLAEHFLYLPSAGFFAGAVLLAGKFLKGIEKRGFISSPVIKAALSAYFLFLFSFLVKQNIYASSEMAMFQQSLFYNPYNVDIQRALGMIYVGRGRLKEAEECFRAALNVHPYSVPVRIALGKVLCDQGRFREGMQEYEKIADPGEHGKLLENNKRLTLEILKKESGK